MAATVFMRDSDGRRYQGRERSIPSLSAFWQVQAEEGLSSVQPQLPAFSVRDTLLLEPLRFCGREWKAITEPLWGSLGGRIWDVVLRVFMGLFLIFATPFAGILGLAGAAMKPHTYSYTVSLDGGAYSGVKPAEVKYLSPDVTNQQVGEAVVDGLAKMNVNHLVHSVTVSSRALNDEVVCLDRRVVIRSSKTCPILDVFAAAFNNSSYHSLIGKHLKLASARWGYMDSGSHGMEVHNVLKRALFAYGTVQFDVPHDLSSVTVTVGT